MAIYSGCTLVNVVVQSAPIVGRKKMAIARNTAIARPRTIEPRSSENVARAAAAAPWPGVLEAATATARSV